MTYNWFYKGKEITCIEDINENIFGFIYKITQKSTGKFYIGKKQLYFNRKKRLTKNEIQKQPIKRGRKSTHKMVTSESDWLTYYGSCKELLKEIKLKGEDDFTKEIIQFVFTKKQLTYYELFYQIKNDVLEIDSFNDNILAKFFREDIIK